MVRLFSQLLLSSTSKCFDKKHNMIDQKSRPMKNTQNIVEGELWISREKLLRKYY